MWKTFIFIRGFMWKNIKSNKNYAFILSLLRITFLRNVDKAEFSTPIFAEMWIIFGGFPQNIRFFRKFALFMQEKCGKCG